MKIYIPTRGRSRQRTVERLGQKVLKAHDAVIVTSKENAASFLGHRSVLGVPELLITPKNVDGIAATRQFILEHARANGHDIVLMLDDDLPTWCGRNTPDPDDGEDAKYHKATEQEIGRGLADFAKVMRGYAHGSIGHRLFCQRHPPLYYNSRMLRALAYNVPRVMGAGASFRLPVMEDFDMALQLFAAGEACVVYNKLVQDQYATNVEGGCSDYRTAAVQANAAATLAAHWPLYATVTTKAPKRKWGGDDFAESRTDVRVNWAKAARDGGCNHARI